MKHITIILALLMTISSPVAAQDYDKGVAAAQAGNFAEAVLEWLPLADQGHTLAQYNMANMYRWGYGVTQDYDAAVKWFRLAAEQGKAEAQHELGIMYYIGDGVSQNYTEAVKWFRLAAEQGNAEAQLNLGILYAFGLGAAPEDYVLGFQWLKVSAANGNQESQETINIIGKKMSAEQLVKAQAMARKCMSSNYKKCGY